MAPPPSARAVGRGRPPALLRAHQAIIQTTGQCPRPLLRFPYGDSDQRTIRIANRLGYGSIRWVVAAPRVC